MSMIDFAERYTRIICYGAGEWAVRARGLLRDAGMEPEIYDGEHNFVVGKAVTLREGSDITLMATGSIMADVLRAADELATGGISVRVLNFNTIKPLDGEAIEKAVTETGHIITVEEHSIYGGFGGAVGEVIADIGVPVHFKRIGLKDFAQGYGKHDEMKAANGISVADIIREAGSMLI